MTEAAYAIPEVEGPLFSWFLSRRGAPRPSGQLKRPADVPAAIVRQTAEQSVQFLDRGQPPVTESARRQ